MLRDLDRFGLLLMRGSIVVAALVWVLLDEAINRIFLDRNVPPASLVTEQVGWSVETDSSHNAKVEVEVFLRNSSDLRLRRLTAAYRLLDCPSAAPLPGDCSAVAEFGETTVVDVAAGLRGRYDVQFVIPAMAKPVGTLRLEYDIRKAAGQTDSTLQR